MGAQKWPCQVLTKAPLKHFRLNVWQMHLTTGEVSADVLYLMLRQACQARTHAHTHMHARTCVHTLSAVHHRIPCSMVSDASLYSTLDKDLRQAVGQI